MFAWNPFLKFGGCLNFFNVSNLKNKHGQGVSVKILAQIIKKNKCAVIVFKLKC